MNLYEIHKNLKLRRRKCTLTAVEQALYYELGTCSIDSDNATSFSVSNDELMCNLNIRDKHTLINARNTLIESGLISYQKGEFKGNRKVFGEYSFINCGVINSTASPTASPTLNSNTNNKLISISNKNPLTPFKGEMDFLDESFRDVFVKWLEYKREKKQSYKGRSSLQTCYNRLKKLSGNNPTTALEIVETSIANNWSGLFALKSDSKPKEVEPKKRKYL